MKIPTITTREVEEFQKDCPLMWHEGLTEEQVKVTLERAYGKYSRLWTIAYWKKGKSYLFQNRLENHVYCISKSYIDQFKLTN